ncbi:MAG: cell wall metabolism sensor histidine kinase WalK [Oscillospiraceae bacterium]|nr:cell wall metabolism sensor histidine kinase WalK [Oscillospiraceae bacterium]
MLYKSLHFKLVLILILFIICIISIIAAVMLSGVIDFYTQTFNDMISRTLNEAIKREICGLMGENDFYVNVENLLKPIYGNMGISGYRNLYVLDMDGKYLAGTDEKLGNSLEKTPNMVAAMARKTGDAQYFNSDYMDYALYISSDMYGSAGGEKIECIIYIKDSLEEMKKFSWKIFAIIIQVLLISLAVAVVLSFFLAKAITAPIHNITKGAVKLANGDFKKKIEVSSSDEIGTLTITFNEMAENLEATIGELENEREKLESERAKLENIFLYLNDGVLVFSHDGTLDLINPKGAGILKDDLNYGGNFGEFMNLFGLDAGEERSVFTDVAFGENIFDISIGKFWEETQSEKSSGGTILVIRDVTQSYALEKSRREFIANVSHELKTPLATILGAAESISDFRMSEENKIKFLNMIQSESERMKRLVQDLLFISALENNKMFWKFSPVDMDASVKNICETMRGEAEKNGQNLILKTEKYIPVIYADKERIEQVLINIISNAIKYTPQNGIIEIFLSGHKFKNPNKENASGIKIVVKDNGMGIPEEDLPHIFDRFYRVEKARSSETGGTGLGLSIAREIVQMHKGDISVENAEMGGTVVSVILPQNSNPKENKQDEN